MRLPPSILRRVHRAQSGRLPLFPFLRAAPKLGRQALSHVDEFQTFSSEALASLLSEARKFASAFLSGEPIYRPELSRPAAPRFSVTPERWPYSGQQPRRRASRAGISSDGPRRPRRPGAFYGVAPARRWPRPHLRRAETVRATWHCRADPRAEPATLRTLARDNRAQRQIIF